MYVHGNIFIHIYILINLVSCQQRAGEAQQGPEGHGGADVLLVGQQQGRDHQGVGLRGVGDVGGRAWPLAATGRSAEALVVSSVAELSEDSVTVKGVGAVVVSVYCRALPLEKVKGDAVEELVGVELVLLLLVLWVPELLELKVELSVLVMDETARLRLSAVVLLVEVVLVELLLLLLVVVVVELLELLLLLLLLLPVDVLEVDELLVELEV